MTATPNLDRARQVSAGLPLLPLPGDGFRGKHSAPGAGGGGKWNESLHPRGPDGRFLGSAAADYSTGMTDDYRESVDLDAAELDAARAYTGQGYENMNGLLRSGEPGPSEGNVPAETWASRVDTLDALAQRYKTPVALNVVRFVYPESIPAGIQPGQTFKDRGFASATLDSSAAPRWMRNAPVQMHLRVPAGSPGIVVNGTGVGMPDEHEFVLPPGAHFTVSADEAVEHNGREVRVLTMDVSFPNNDRPASQRSAQAHHRSTRPATGFARRMADVQLELVDPAPEPDPAHRSETDLWLYWTAGKGRARWTTAPQPLLALYGELVKHMTPEKAHSAALAWLEDGLGRKPRISDGTLPEVGS